MEDLDSLSFLGIENNEIVFNFEDQEEVKSVLRAFIRGHKEELERLSRAYNTGNLYKEMD